MTRGATIGSAALGVVVVGAIAFTAWRDGHKREESARWSAALAASQAAHEKPLMEAAQDTVRAIREAHPFACRAASLDDRWATCHDDTKGFDAAVACVARAADDASALRASFQPGSYSSACGKEIAAKSSAFVVGIGGFLADVRAWMLAHRATFAPAMANRTMTDACDVADCKTMPSAFDPKYEAATYAPVSQIECTKTMFRCGVSDANVCDLGKAAARLGASCDRAEDKLSDPLVVRATGRRAN